MVERKPSKLHTRVRFPSPAPISREFSMSKRTLKAAAVQFESQPGGKVANFKKIEHFVELAAAQGVRLVVFPECCITGYWFIRNLSLKELAGLAEPISDGPSTRQLLALAGKHGISIGAGLVEDAGAGRFHNSYVVAL